MQQETQTSKAALAQELGISRQSLYYISKKKENDDVLKKQIDAVLLEHPAYGHRRIAIQLGMNKKRVLRIMRTHDLKPRISRKIPKKPNDIGKQDTAILNSAKTVCPIVPNAMWAGDFTYIPYKNTFLYLATVIDVYTRELIGWHIATHHTTALIEQACVDAIRRRRTAPHLFHSDQGSEYTSERFMRLLHYHHIRPSHSNKSSPWENGYQESFYSQFKLELGNAQRFDDLGQLIEAIHQQMHYYNTKRIHTALKMSPVQFYQHHYLTHPLKSTV